MNNIISSVVRVGISDLNIAIAPDTIRTSGLGSCVGCVVYDIQRQIAGLAHVMLPDSHLTKQYNFNVYKYADTAIPALIDKLINQGAKKNGLKAKIAGGAQMFQFKNSTSIMRIGSRNVEAIKEQLANFQIPIVAEDTGGNNGRTIEFDPSTGRLSIRTVNKGEKYI